MFVYVFVYINTHTYIYSEVETIEIDTPRKQSAVGMCQTVCTHCF